MMAIPLYLSFSILDRYCFPTLWKDFLWIRIGSCVLYGVLGLVLKYAKSFAANHIVLLCHSGTAILGVGIGYMTHVTGGLASPYYAGLNWIAIGSLAFWPGRPKDISISIGSIYGCLFVLELASFRFQSDAASLLALTFMAGTCLLSVMNNVLSMRSLEHEFELRKELQSLIRNKDQIIEMKSNESANLKRLAKQFSPAVIQAIESQTISLTERSRKKVAIMFIDVVDSTSRSSYLDHADYQKTLDVFFDMVIKQLLARNLTIANFMGDGIMAIANAPYKLADFEKIAFETGLQIIEETNRRQKSLRELWHGEFGVRVGISSGFVTVGFFPNTDFGVYTALGEAVNLASRLCSAAKAQTVATTKAVISAASDTTTKFSVKRGGSVSDLKGFTANDLEFYLASPAVAEEEVLNIAQCPLCSHALVLGADLENCVMLKCTQCQYTDIQEKAALPQGIPLLKAG